MGLRINSNVQSLVAQNYLQRTTKRLQSSLVRLSTGLRINTGQDDVVGLVKSELLRARIRGIDIAQQNVSNSTAFVGVAEGYLSQLTEIAQQMREAAVQASDSTIDSTSRRTLQDNFDTLMTEYNRLASGANFTGINLLDGTFTNKELQIGANEGETLSISISDARSASIGQVAVFTAVSLAFTSTQAGAVADFADPGGSLSFTVGGSSYNVNGGDYEDDGVSFLDADESAIAYVNAINKVSGSTGITATVNANVFTIDYSVAGGGAGLEANQDVIINGVTVKSSSLAVSQADDTDASSLVSLINDFSTQTGVEASLDTGNDRIILNASDGRNITIQVGARGAVGSSFNAFNMVGTNGGATDNTQATYRGTFKLASSESFTVNDGTTGNIVAGAATTSVNIDTNTSLINAGLGTETAARSSITILDNVLEQLQSRRADVGSTLTRLELAIAELQSRKENLTSSESLVRDADVAIETARMTQDQILQQAGVTVLAQANSSPQIALSLLSNLNI